MTMAWSDGWFAGFRSAADDPRSRPDPCVLRGLDRLVGVFAGEAAYLGFPAGFIAAMADGLAGAFRRLDALDRDHPSWDGTNRRPTSGKLGPFCWTELQDDPADRRGLWGVAASETIVGMAFSPETWGRLASAGPVDPAWVACAALHAECIGSYDTAPAFARWVGEHGGRDRAVSFLADEVAHGRDEPGRAIPSRASAAAWARQALDRIGGAS